SDTRISGAGIFVAVRVLTLFIAPDLIALGKRRERIRYRHLARFVPLQPHFFKDFAAGKALSLADDIHKFFAPRTAANLPSPGRSASGRLPFATLRCLVGTDGLEFAIDLRQPLIQLSLLGDNSFSFSVEPITFAADVL